MDTLSYQETPVVEIQEAFLRSADVRLLVKREDLNHRFVSGNKWWKLKYNLIEAIRTGHNTLLTFGGAYSNHIFAVAATARELGLKSIGVIRGNESRPLNHTLSFASEQGMVLHHVSREEYRGKNEIDFVEGLRKQFGDFYLLPEGGTNELAIKGCEEFARTNLSALTFDYLCLPVGTGGTMAGIVKGLEGRRKVIGYSSLKGTFLETELRSLLKEEEVPNWRIESDYHFGGYGKTTPGLNEFISVMRETQAIPLDHVYTAKMMYGIYDMIKTGRFEKSSVVLMLHTGGMQGQQELKIKD